MDTTKTGYKDYRLPENRVEYFTKLYSMNLNYGIMPGLVYLYMPELAKRLRWDTEQKLWFAFLNGNTQNPITSLRIMERFDHVPSTPGAKKELTDWFNENWETLNFDTDRRYQKKDFPEAVSSYSNLIYNCRYGSQRALLTGTFGELWDRVISGFHSFGRLAAFSYLEYVRIMGCGADCTELFLDDKQGSKSHRNGLLFLLGMDELVWDKRQPNSHDGNYENFKSRMVPWLNGATNNYLRNCGIDHPDLGYFTFESQCCQFKNGFFRRRYPGVYADMAWDRIKWYRDRGMGKITTIFRQIREDRLPEWLREECETPTEDRARKAALFAETGIPFRSEYFL